MRKCRWQIPSQAVLSLVREAGVLISMVPSMWTFPRSKKKAVIQNLVRFSGLSLLTIALSVKLNLLVFSAQDSLSVVCRYNNPNRNTEEALRVLF